jgi:hypothetical protein
MSPKSFLSHPRVLLGDTKLLHVSHAKPWATQRDFEETYRVSVALKKFLDGTKLLGVASEKPCVADWRCLRRRNGQEAAAPGMVEGVDPICDVVDPRRRRSLG